MAWRSGGSTNAELISNLFKNGLITAPHIRDGMLKVDRANYCPSKSAAYQDSPQPIGHSATISAPHMHASALESLFPSSRDTTTSYPGSMPYMTSSPSAADYATQRSGNRPLRVLDVGSGSGYLTHCIAELVGEGGRVVGIEHIQELADLGRENMSKSSEGRQFLEGGRVEFVVGDGRLGWHDSGSLAARGGDADGGNGGSEEQQWEQWDTIHVGAAAASIHEELVKQLKRPGRMFIPVDDDGVYGQHVWVVDKDREGKVGKRKLYGVSYVPLVDPGKSMSFGGENDNETKQ